MARLLMVPGPTPVDPEVLLAMAKPVISHTSREFDEIHGETLRMLSKVLGTQGSVFLIPGSGTLAMEFASRLAVARARRALVLKAGFFGGYFERILRSLGVEVVVRESRVGEGFDAEAVKAAIDDAGGVDAVFIQHVETSTSVANPIAEVARAVKGSGAMLVVDGIASIGGMDMRMEEWGVDICLTGSQKALSTPPGLGIVALSSRAKDLVDEAGAHGVYFDFRAVAREMESTLNYHITPAVNLVYGLHRSLSRILEEGLESRYERHRVLAKAVQAGLESMGLELVASRRFRAWTVTAAYLPRGVSWPEFYAAVKSRGVELAGGLGALRGRIFRVGHMGEVDANDVVAALAVVERALKAMGINVKLGSGVAAAQEALASEGA